MSRGFSTEFGIVLSRPDALIAMSIYKERTELNKLLKPELIAFLSERGVAQEDMYDDVETKKGEIGYKIKCADSLREMAFCILTEEVKAVVDEACSKIGSKVMDGLELIAEMEVEDIMAVEESTPPVTPEVGAELDEEHPRI